MTMRDTVSLIFVMLENAKTPHYEVIEQSKGYHKPNGESKND